MVRAEVGIQFLGNSSKLHVQALPGAHESRLKLVERRVLLRFIIHKKKAQWFYCASCLEVPVKVLVVLTGLQLT